MKKQLLLLFIGLLANLYILQGQAISTDRATGEAIIQLVKSDITIEQVIGQLNRKWPEADVAVERVLAPRWRIYLLRFDENAISISTSEKTIMSTLRSTPGVAAAQWNHLVEERAQPDDTNWAEQIDMRLIGMEQTWENSTGGLTPAGDTIVVAILEQGMQPGHPDLLPNMWRNWRETPGNGIDDDNNGYVDDYTGFNARTELDAEDGNGRSHGTSVHGIVGARGNNNQGVSGVNWTVKMMPILECIQVSEIIAGYNYVADLRRTYNETGGQRGAFVVATNASFGIDNEFASEHPLWCAVYDELGQVGILSIGATTNRNVDVDIVGDMPTTCTSEFLVTVTNVAANTGQKVEAAGYGSTSIDMGAPGQGSYTTVNGTPDMPARYGSFGGTSAACPHVTGAVALMYSLKCDGFVADARTNPLRCTERVRDALLHNLQREPTLSGTKTSGRLNVAYIVRDVEELCAGTVGDLDIFDIRPNPTGDVLQIRYQTPDFELKYRIEVYDMTGRLMLSETFAPPFDESKKYLLNVSRLIPGMYVVRLTDDEKGESRKFYKK
jgi:hypothetical protein